MDHKIEEARVSLDINRWSGSGGVCDGGEDLLEFAFGSRCASNRMIGS
jgi:hypothetical protein